MAKSDDQRIVAENKCCPFLDTAGCADTEEHRHLICAFSNTAIANSTIVDLCLGDFSKCVVGGNQ